LTRLDVAQFVSPTSRQLIEVKDQWIDQSIDRSVTQSELS